MFRFLVLLICVDIPPQDHFLSVEEQGLRRALLHLAFADVKAEARVCFLKDSPDDPKYTFKQGGVTLVGGRVTAVMLSGIPDLGNFNIHALPHSTTHICITQSHQKYSVETRMLPSRLVSLSISDNEIFGPIDLTHLPNGLMSLVASNNNICGPIDLTRLPQTLRNLFLQSNEINQRIFVYANLPTDSLCISLRNQRPIWNDIMAARPLREEDKLSDFRARVVFLGIMHIPLPVF